MYCTKCGSILNPDKDTMFCTDCGEKIGGAEQEYPQGVTRGYLLLLQTGKPQKVGIAVILLYIFLGIRLVENIIYPIQLFEGLPSGITSSLVFVGFGVHWLFIYMIGKGRNWARIVYFVLFLISWLVFLPQIPTLFMDPIPGLFTTVRAVVQIIAFVLLFQKQSSDWFSGFLQSQQRR